MAHSWAYSQYKHTHMHICQVLLSWFCDYQPAACRISLSQKHLWGPHHLSPPVPPPSPIVIIRAHHCGRWHKLNLRRREPRRIGTFKASVSNPAHRCACWSVAPLHVTPPNPPHQQHRFIVPIFMCPLHWKKKKYIFFSLMISVLLSPIWVCVCLCIRPYNRCVFLHY